MNIKIYEICEYLLSNVDNKDLQKISNESDIVFLRETAKKMLDQ